MTWRERSTCCKRPVIVDYIDAPKSAMNPTGQKQRTIICKGCKKPCESINL